MRSGDAIRAMVSYSGQSLRAASVAAGRTPTFLTGTLARGSSPTLDTAADFADACGYSLAFVPVDDVPPTALVIDAARPRDAG